MTTKECKIMLTRLKDRLNFEVTDSQKKMDALNMATQSLDAWEEVKNEIKKIRDYYTQQATGHLGFLYGLNLAEKIIDEHLKEVNNES